MAGLEVNLGDLPTWVAAGAAMVAVIQAQRVERVVDFAELVRRETGLTDEEVAVIARDRAEFAQLLEAGIEAAARAAAVEKRRLLARVIRAGVSGDSAQVLEADVLMRAVVALEPYHVRMLVAVGLAEDDALPRIDRPASDFRRTFRDRMRDLDPSGTMEGPMAAALLAEDLITRTLTEDDEGSVAVCHLTTFGRRFLLFVPDEDASGLVLVGTRLSVEMGGGADGGVWVKVHNHGLDEAQVEVARPEAAHGSAATLRLRPGGSRTFSFSFEVEDRMTYQPKFEVVWQGPGCQVPHRHEFRVDLTSSSNPSLLQVRGVCPLLECDHRG